MTKLVKDTKNRKLEVKSAVCRICGTEGLFQSYLVREMMQNTKEEFEYFVCSNCGCLQIKEAPADLDRFYSQDYYSFSQKEIPEMEYGTAVTNQEKILDVGCGNGEWLVNKAKQGWGNLYGCDPYIERNLQYGERVHISRCSIHEIEEAEVFDVIRMEDSFEHMSDPLEALQSVKRLLKPGGNLIMSIPVYPNIAFDLFETHWYQLDAPRHIFLHSRKSLEYLAQKSGLQMIGMKYDSNNTQIIRSFFYQHGVPFEEMTQENVQECFSTEDIKSMNETSVECNEKEYGDHAIIFMKKVI